MDQTSHPIQSFTAALPALSLTPSELRAELRGYAQSSVERTQSAFAEDITVQAVLTYWASLTSSLTVSTPPRIARTLSAPVAASARRFGEALASLPVAEAGYQLGLLYTSLLPSALRAARGIYYTPPVLADRLLDQAEAAGIDFSKAHVLDPAAGAGAFLIPAAQRMLRSLGKCSPAIAVQNLNARIRGYEIDGFAAWLGQVLIEAAALPVIAAAGRRPAQLITVQDSLTADMPPQGFDLVIGNPPFGKLSLPPTQRGRFARSLYGHANLYGIFMDLAVQLTRPGGLISFLTPSSFLAGEYFKNLRALLWREAPPASLAFVTMRKGVFDDVLQETILATYKKSAKRGRASVSFLHPQPGKLLMPEPAGHFTLPKKSTAPWLLPRHDDEAKLAQRLRSMPNRLADWGYKVSTGPLVWNRFKSQLLDTPAQDTVPLLWAECVTSTGSFLFRSERRNHKPYFRVQAADDWLIVDRPCVLLQRTTAKEQARRLIAAELPAAFLKKHKAVTVENHLNMLIPIGKPAVPPALLAEFLNTMAADRAFRCLSGSVAVSAYELENLPLPAAADLKRLAGRGYTRDKIEEICKVLYAKEGAG